MITFILSDANYWYSFTLGIVVVVCLVEISGLFFGVSLLGVYDDITTIELGFEEEPEQDIISILGRWLCLDKLPLVIWLVILLSTFSMIGYTVNYFFHLSTGEFAASEISFTIAFVASLVLTSRAGAIISKRLPKPKKNRIQIEHFVGSVAEITFGVARSGVPAEAKMTDGAKKEHYILVEPIEKHDNFAQGEKVLLIQKHKDSWLATHYR